MTPLVEVSSEFPAKLQCLFVPARYIVLWGGRGGAKSWGVARALLLQGVQRPLRVLCARELQNSIKDSVHRLLSQQIKALGLSHLYDVQQASIKGPNGTEFNFEGIRNNADKIRSYEGIDVCWLEEAANISKSSMDEVIPTIRKEGSTIILTLNPNLESDYIYEHFIKNPPPTVIDGKRWCVVQKINWRDNPWFPQVLMQEMEDLKTKDYDSYLHVWEGNCKQVFEGAIYMDELREVVAEGRITKVPWERSIPVDTYWDLGRNNNTAIWFAQYVGFEYRILDFYQNRLKGFDHYIDVLIARGYTYGTAWLPHDAKAKTLGTKKSIEEQAKAKLPRVRIAPKLSVSDGIEAARTVFPNCWFDERKTTEGLKCLRNYRFELIAGTQTYSQAPCHDQYSDGADAFRIFGVACGAPKRAPVLNLLDKAREVAEDFFTVNGPTSQEWMR